MLIRPRDAARNDREWKDALHRYSFGQVVATGVGRELPVIVPAHFVFDGEGTVLLHLAFDNPIWQALAERPVATLAVVGAYTYVPGAWNADPAGAPDRGVPTSYLAAVQVSGPVEVIDDADELVQVLAEQLDRFEPEGTTISPRSSEFPHRAQLAAIRGIRLHIEHVEAKFKFGGNKTVAQREAIAAHLTARGGANDLEAREHLLRRMPAASPESAASQTSAGPLDMAPGNHHRIS